MSLLTAVFLKRKQASAVVLVGILTYVFLAGAGAAVVRAGIMGSVVVLSALVGRIVSSRNLLLAAMAAMLMHNPLLLRDDVGFQLSFAATAGLVVLQPKLSGFFSFVPKFAGIRESLSMSIAAIAATLPVIFVSFGQVSLVAPFANLFVLPLVPFVMIAGACVIIVSSMFYEVALCISAPVVGGLKIIFGISHILSSLSFASVDIAHVSWLRALVFILSIILLRSILTLKPIKNSESNGGLSFKYFVMVSAILCLPIIPDLFPSRIFTSTFFSVGQGDSTFFELPSGQRLLIDGGPDETVLVKLGQTLPWYSRRIDSFFLTHADADHITGAVSVSKRYEIKNVYLSADSHTSNMEILRDVWSIRGVPVSFVNAGYVVDFQDTKLNVLAPRTGLASSDNNKSSMILEVMYKDKKILLMGDADKETELEILTRLSHADVLKVGHHGSYTSTSQEFLKSISADLAVISVGENNIYGHPHGIVLDRLKKSGVEILRTDLFGDIRIQISENGELTTLAGSPTY
jgi:competence protein ComEC